MVYSAANDPACYPGTDILRNKADIKNPALLTEFELVMSITRMDEGLPEGQLDYTHYRALHYHLFQDVYDWAGQIRKIRTGKSGHWFCYPEHIDQEMTRLFAGLSNENWFVSLSKISFIEKAAHFLAEVNAIHPFREGNGRTQIAFIILLANNAGFSVDGEKLNSNVMLEAMIMSFKGNETPLKKLLSDFINT